MLRGRHQPRQRASPSRSHRQAPGAAVAVQRVLNSLPRTMVLPVARCGVVVSLATSAEAVWSPRTRQHGKREGRVRYRQATRRLGENAKPTGGKRSLHAQLHCPAIAHLSRRRVGIARAALIETVVCGGGSLRRIWEGGGREKTWGPSQSRELWS